MRKFTLMIAILIFASVQLAFGQRAITGKVTSSEDGKPIPGATVLVKGTTIGVAADAFGNFKLNIPAETKVLVVRFVGMKSKEVALGSSDVYNVVLDPDVMDIEGVVITALGIKRSEKSLGYSAQNVKGADIVKAPEMNVVNSLSGKVSGVNVTNSSGAVGASSRIVLRGASSVYGNNQPLFIIDGVPVSNTNTGSSDGNGGFDIPNGIADINPNDIASIDVLKGPNAAALYGIRASNGVIVITTKKGEGSAGSKWVGVEYNSTVTFETPLILPSFQNSYGQGSSDKHFEYINGTSGDGGVDESWGPPLDVGLNFMQFSSFINNPDNPQPEPWVSHPDNIRNFYETGITQNHNVAFTGGNATTSYRLGLGYSNQKGMIPFTDFQKVNVNVGATHKFSKKLRSQFSVKFNNSTSDNLPSTGYDGANPIQQSIWAGRQVDFSILKDWRNLPLALPGSGYGEGVVPINWNTAFQNNPYWQLENNTNSFDRNRVIGNVGLVYDFTDWLSLSGNVGVDNYTTLTSSRFAKGSGADAPTYWRFSGDGNRDTDKGYYDEDIQSFFETNMDMMLAFNKKIGKDFKLSANLGGNRMHRVRQWDFTGIQIGLPGLYNLNNVLDGTTPYRVNKHYEQGINSIYGSAELAYREWLFVNFTGRNDWASVLPLTNNSFFYPSATVSAVLSEVIDFKEDKISFLKVYGGWAEVGGFGPLAEGDILPVYELSAVPWNTYVFGEYPTTLNNANIKTQSTQGLEGGVDLRMFYNRLRLNATVYSQTSTDLVLPVQVSAASGVYYVWDNVGELQNNGIELQLGSTVVKKKDLNIDLDLNFAKNKNNVITVGTDDDPDVEETLIIGSTWNMELQVREGHPYGAIVGTSLARNENDEVIYENGLPVVGDKIVLGNIQPDFTGGVNLGVRYKKMVFTTLVDGKWGGEIYTMTNAWGRYSGILAETVYGRETGIIGNGVMQDGVDANGDPVWVPNNVTVSAETFNHNAYGNDIVETSVFDASFIKLREVSLGVDLTDVLKAGELFQNVSLSVVGRNLAILYKKVPHIDPETGYSNANSNQGQEFGQLASARSIGLKLNLSF